MLWILQGDAFDKLLDLPRESVQCCVTSPPYWGLRDYGVEGQIGLEETPEAYAAKLVEIFREVRRVLKNDGTLWLNLGDSYATSNPAGRRDSGDGTSEKFGNHEINGSFAESTRRNTGLKPKDLCGIPWRVAFALQADGWYLRSDIIWAKPNPMPESVTDRPTKAHEYLFLLSKRERYFYDNEAIQEAATDLETLSGKRRPSVEPLYLVTGNNGSGRIRSNLHDQAPRETRNKRSVWTVPTAPYAEAHFATFPPDLIKPCIRAGSRFGDTILDPFAGSGTTGAVAIELARNAILIELNSAYIPLIERRCMITPGLGL